MSRFPLLNQAARDFIIERVKEEGYCSFGGHDQDIYGFFPSGSTRTLIKYDQNQSREDIEKCRQEAWKQCKEFEAECRRHRGTIFQAIIDGFENWQPSDEAPISNAS